jgi:hypothetical protein
MYTRDNECWMDAVRKAWRKKGKKKLGMIPRKSREDSTKVFDNIPEHVMNHFLRGLFDGDGYASF